MSKYCAQKEEYFAFSSRLRSAVEKTGMTQGEVAKRAGISEVSMSRYMNGMRIPRTVVLARLCSALRCDANWLIGVKDKSLLEGDNG